MSHVLINLVSKLLNKKTKANNRNDYYLNKIYFKRLTTLRDLYYQKKVEKEIYITKETIQPLNLPFTSTYKRVIKAVGDPRFIFNNKKAQNNHKAIIIRQVICNATFNIQLQFHNDQLFFIGFELLTKIDTNEEKIAIANTIIKKYFDKESANVNALPAIEDKNGSFIIINEEFNYSICYFGYNSYEALNQINSIRNAESKLPNSKDKEGLYYAF